MQCQLGCPADFTANHQILPLVSKFLQFLLEPTIYLFSASQQAAVQYHQPGMVLPTVLMLSVSAMLPVCAAIFQIIRNAQSRTVE